MAADPPSNDRDPLADRGFVPGRRALPGLFERLKGDRDDAKLALRALTRVDSALATRIVAVAAEATPRDRARLVQLAARRLGHEDPAGLTPFLRASLADPDAAVRRAAAAGLGRTSAEAEPDLLAALDRETDPSARRVMTEALGKIGSGEAVAAIAAMPAADAETDRVRDVALARARRTATRPPDETLEVWSLDEPWSPPARLFLGCRPGLATILAEEVRAALGVIAAVGRDGVELTWAGTTRDLFRARTWDGLAVVLEPRRAGSDAAVVSAAADALASTDALAAIRRLGPTSPARYRIEWSTAGKRRRATADLAAEVARRTSMWVNDPRRAPWRVEVAVRGDRVATTLHPSVPDPRFAYRSRDVPAASHPTVAAAIALLAAPQADDVVWDPFVGSGLELCEMFRRGAPRALFGSDVDERALTAARANTTGAGATHARFALGDALTVDPPERPTVIVTNPPLGRRIGTSDEATLLLTRFVARAASVLPTGGRLVWMTPRPRVTDEAARRGGLSQITSVRVDLGGVHAWLQKWSRPAARPHRAPPSRSEGGRGGEMAAPRSHGGVAPRSRTNARTGSRAGGGTAKSRR